MQDLMENFKKIPVLIQTNFPSDNLVTMPEYKKYLPIKLNETKLKPKQLTYHLIYLPILNNHLYG